MKYDIYIVLIIELGIGIELSVESMPNKITIIWQGVKRVLGCIGYSSDLTSEKSGATVFSDAQILN